MPSNSTAGPHLVTINDGSSLFCVNVTCLPQVTSNYTDSGSWLTSNSTVNLTIDYTGTQIYYQINNGTVENVAANDEPTLSTQGANNTLTYWGTWNTYGTRNITLTKTTLAGIKLQTTPPNGTMQINGGAPTVDSRVVTLTLNATDSLSGISQIRFSNDGTWNQSVWQPYSNSVVWHLTDENGSKTVYCQIQDNAGLTTTVNATVTLALPAQIISPQITDESTPTPTPTSNTTTTSPTATPTPSSQTESSPTPTGTPTNEPTATPQVPERNCTTGPCSLVGSSVCRLHR